MLLRPQLTMMRYLRKERIAHDSYSFFFDRSRSSFDFFPGQYIRMLLPHESPDDRGTSRFFTISSSPTQVGALVITTKHGESSFKKALFSLQEGTNVSIWGPIGAFTLDAKTPSYVFLAGGIGITPFHSMITYVHEHNLAIPILLIVSFSNVEDMLFYEELLAIANMRKTIRVVYTITESDRHTVMANAEKGRISSEMIHIYDNALFVDRRYYICGPEKMVEAMQRELALLNIAQDKIITEKMSGY